VRTTHTFLFADINDQTDWLECVRANIPFPLCHSLDRPDEPKTPSSNCIEIPASDLIVAKLS
jgi:hypothetical protein